eukprot:c25569_g2_i1 orf=416-2212(+)
MRRWKIVSRPLMETVLKNYALRVSVMQPLIIHGPRGVGKRTLIEGMMKSWQNAPDDVLFLDFSPEQRTSHLCSLPPWTFVGDKYTSSQAASLLEIQTLVENGLEKFIKKASQLGCLTSYEVFKQLKKDHAIDGALLQFLQKDAELSEARVARLRNTSDLWREALYQLSKKLQSKEIHIDSCLAAQDWDAESSTKFHAVTAWHTALKHSIHHRLSYDRIGSLTYKQNLEELQSFKETLLSLLLAKILLNIQVKWRKAAGTFLKQKGSISKSFADSTTSWALLLVLLLSRAAVKNYFQPKLVIDSFDIMRKAVASPTDGYIIDGRTYHDSLLLQLIKLAVNESCMPIILISSDSYYSWQIYEDFGAPDILISREVYGWTPQEAKSHLVPKTFSEDEWQVITGVLGSNPRHLVELQALKQSLPFDRLLVEVGGSVEDCIDIYLGYLQVSAVDPAMDAAIGILEKFADDAWKGKIARSWIFRHGAPWRHPPKCSQFEKRNHWARLQLMDYVEALSKAEFGVNYLGESGKEILEDPSTAALLEVGLLYQQKDPSYIRPISHGIKRCLIRWLVKEKLQWTPMDRIQYYWHRLVRGRSYRHLMVI